MVKQQAGKLWSRLRRDASRGKRLKKRHVFGLEKNLLTWGVKLHHIFLNRTEEKQEALETIEQYLQRID